MRGAAKSTLDRGCPFSRFSENTTDVHHEHNLHCAVSRWQRVADATKLSLRCKPAGLEIVGDRCYSCWRIQRAHTTEANIMGLANGVHHLAICTKDIKTQIEFFTQVVGAELVALYWMHGVDTTFHGFLKLSDSSSIAFVQHPDIAKITPIKGVSHAGTTAGNVAPGVMQHLALNVDSEADLLAIRDRVRSHGNWIMGPLDHGFCKSIYLAAPEGIMLEFSTSEGNSIDAEA